MIEKRKAFGLETDQIGRVRQEQERPGLVAGRQVDSKIEIAFLQHRSNPLFFIDREQAPLGGLIIIEADGKDLVNDARCLDDAADARLHQRSEEHTSELQSLMRSSYAVFCLKKKNNN